MQEVRTTEGLAGISAAIAHDGRLLWSGGAGFADLEHQIPATGTTIHRIASISKALTATAVLQLVQSGRIDLDTPVQTYLPEYPKSPRGEILIRHLLSHTAGIRHYRGRENRTQLHYDSLTDACNVFQNDPLLFGNAPGAEYRYTTYGYTVLGAIIEAVSDNSFEAYMREHIWLPAGMTWTSLEITGVHVDNKAALYKRGPKRSVVADTVDDLSVKYPGGGMQSTAEDLVRFAIAFMGTELLEPETRDLMFQNTAPRSTWTAAATKANPPFLYGFGWIYGETPDGEPFYRHDGGQAGTTTNLMVDPSRQAARRRGPRKHLRRSRPRPKDLLGTGRTLVLETGGGGIGPNLPQPHHARPWLRPIRAPAPCPGIRAPGSPCRSETV